MDLLEILLIAVGLAMDAFAVSLCKGFALRKVTFRAMLLAGIWFGVFQALMPVIGFYLGGSFYDLISAYDHWVAFFLLLLIGANMIRESVFGDDGDVDADMGVRTMALLAVATSIDALAVGISLAMSERSIAWPAFLIGIVTLLLSMVGVKAGSLFGDRFGRKAEILGGAILILIGLKVLLEGLGLI